MLLKELNVTQDKKNMYQLFVLEFKTSAKANFSQLQFFQATAKLELRKTVLSFFFVQQIENCFETVEKTRI